MNGRDWSLYYLHVRVRKYLKIGWEERHPTVETICYTRLMLEAWWAMKMKTIEALKLVISSLSHANNYMHCRCTVYVCQSLHKLVKKFWKFILWGRQWLSFGLLRRRSRSQKSRTIHSSHECPLVLEIVFVEHPCLHLACVALKCLGD